MSHEPSQPQQIALQNVKANVIKIGTITQTINYTQRQLALSSVVNEGLPPLPQDELWQVRREETQLAEWLREGTFRVIGLEGAGGYGKSAMAAQVVRSDLGFGREPLWVNFQEPIEFGTFARWVIRRLVGEVRYDQIRETYERLSNADLVQRVLSELTQNPCLLVMDNLETLLQSEELWQFYGVFLDGWLGRSGGGCVLLTSQYRLEMPRASVWQWMPLRGLETEQGVALLQGEGVIGAREDLEAFVLAADGHPLLLTLAVNLLKRQAKEDREQPEILRLGQGAVEILRGIVEAHRGDAEASVGKVLDASFERLYPVWMRVLLWRLSVVRRQFGLEMAQAMMEETVELKDLRGLVRWSFLQEEKIDGDWQFSFLPLIGRYLQLGAQEQNELAVAHEAAIAYYSAHYQDWDGTIESCRSELENFYHACELGQYGRAYGFINRCFNLLDLAGQWQLLLPLYERLTSEWVAADDNETKNLGWTWTSLGNLYQSLSRYQEAITSHRHALKLFTYLDFSKGQSVSLGNLGNAYHFLGQYQQAIDLHQQSLEIKHQIGDINGEANSLSNLGNIYHSLGQYKKTIDFHKQALEIWRTIRNRNGEASSLSGMGNAYYSLSRYQQAIDFYQQSLEIQQEIKDLPGEAISLGNLGSTYYSLGQYKQAHYYQAIEYQQQSLAIKRKIGDRNGEAVTLCGLGLVYSSLGQYQKAIDFHQQSLEIQRNIEDYYGEGNSLAGLGNIYLLLGQYNLAIHHYQQSLDIQRSIKNRCGQATSLNGLGNAYNALGQYRQAIEFHKKSLEIDCEISNRSGEATSSWNLAQIFQKCGYLRLAMKYRHQAYQAWQAINVPVTTLPFPTLVKHLIRKRGNDWAEQLIASEKSIAWLMIPISYLLFSLRLLLSPLTQLQTRLKIPPKFFWFAVGLAIVLLLWWLKR